jgi:hypothetical protein
VALLALTGLGACSGASSSGVHLAAAAPLPATTPHVVMADAQTGWAVWPSGDSWLVLHTSDGWAHTDNATPVGVPTGGGLVLADAADGSAAVAVGPFDRLLFSPLLVRTATATWSPEELPGAVTDARSAVSLSGSSATAVLRSGRGTVVAGAPAGWRTVTDAARLAPGRGLRVDTVTWADRDRGWLTGHGDGGSPVAFQTTDAGRTWGQLRLVEGTLAAALAPCGSGQTWVLPVISSGGRVAFSRTTDGGRSWTRGGSLRLASGRPAWGCHGDRVWSAGRAAGRDDIFSSADGGAGWRDRGPAPRGLVDLVPLGDGTGWATSQEGMTATLWAVSADGAQLRRHRLPAWVSTIGASGSQS